MFRLAVALAVVLPQAAEAGPRQQEQLYAPTKRTITVSNAKVTAVLDRQIGNPGDTVKLRLETDRPVELGIVVMGSSGNEGRDIPYPDLGVLLRTVKVSTTAEVPIKLRGAKSFGAFAQYRIIVTTPKEAVTLERLRSRATLPIHPKVGRPEMSKSGEAHSDSLSNLDPKTTATLYAVARTLTKSIAIVAPETAKRGKVFDVRVTFPNLVDVDRLTVVLQSPITLAGDDANRVPSDAITIDPRAIQTAVISRRPREVTFQVTVKKPGPLGLIATCTGCGDDNGTAFEAVEITD